MAVDFLMIASSSAETERDFSSVGRMITSLRSRLSRGEHGQASPWTDMDGHGHGRTDGRPWTAIKINKASAGPLAPKIGILTILMSPVTLQLFFMPSDYGVVLLW